MAIDLKGRHFLKELDFTRRGVPRPGRAGRRAQGRQEGGHRGAAAARQEHRADLREDLHPHPLRLRGRRRRPGRVHHLPRPARARRSGTRSRSRTPPGCSAGCSTASSTAATARPTVEELAAYAGVPVYNGLTDDWHPTQMLADVLTMTEHTRQAAAREIAFAYLGDARFNMGNSYLVTGALLGMDVRIVAPARATGPPRTSSPRPARLAEAQRRADHAHRGRRRGRARRATSSSPTCGCRWASPRRSGTSGSRALAPYAVTMDVLRATGNPDVKFLHCLPAFHDLGHRGRPGDPRAVRADATGGHRRGLRVRALGRLRPGGEPDAHDQGRPGRHARLTGPDPAARASVRRSAHCGGRLSDAGSA